MNTDLLSTISGLIDTAKYSDNLDLQKEIVVLAHKYLTIAMGECPKSIECVRSIYENDGFIPAIKEWRALSNKGLKDAKEDVERAADKGKWKHHLVGKTMRIISTNEYIQGQLCKIIKATYKSNECTVILYKDGVEREVLINRLTEVQ